MAAFFVHSRYKIDFLSSNLWKSLILQNFRSEKRFARKRLEWFFGVVPNVINLSLQPRYVSLWRHSGESRNPVFSGPPDPGACPGLRSGVRRGDGLGDPIPLKLTALSRTMLSY